MKYLFFDIECANCYLGKGKIYSFGYVVTDEDFNVVISPTDMLINPASNFDPYVRKNILAYDKALFKTLPKFDEAYEVIKGLMAAEDTVCFGYGIQNDLRFLSDDCARYGLSPIKAKTFDVQKLIEIAEFKRAKKLDVEYTERTGNEPRGTHRSDEDAMRTAEIARSVCEAKGKKLHEFFLRKDGKMKKTIDLTFNKYDLPDKSVFSEAEWIWTETPYSADDYAEFKVSLPVCDNVKKAKLRVSCDGAFAAYVGGKLVLFSQCADFPDHKYYDEQDVTAFISGKTTTDLIIRVWHFGVDTANYVKADAGVIFELSCDGKIVAYSSPDTSSRVMCEYKNDYRKQISGQLGYSFLFDNRVKAGNYSKSLTVNKSTEFYARQRKNLAIGRRAKAKIERKENSLLIDLYAETCGFLDICVRSKKDVKLTIAYGEHLIDGGHVRRLVGDRDFSVEVILGKGMNAYLNPFRRLAGRYLEIFAEYVDGNSSADENALDDIEVEYAGLRAVYYPVTEKKLKFADKDVQAITDVCINTLKVCMHEHYEDCAWREQGLYSLDSRNQALCGYYAFSGHEYQRANIITLAYGLREDGLLSLTAPGGIDYPIPFFSLVYFQTVYEYLAHTRDYSVLTVVAPVLRKIFSTFESEICDNGLIARFSPAPFWNFYEWTEGLDGWDSDMKDPAVRKKEKVFDAPLNLAFIIAADYYDRIFDENHNTENMKKAVRERFYDREKNEFRISDTDEKSSQFVTALAILAGVADRNDAEKMIAGGQIAASLSTKAYVYDALIKLGGYENYIINDIKRVYMPMIEQGATSVWETESGAADFGGAGSLCHGWSAIPIYYFRKLLKV